MSTEVLTVQEGITVEEALKILINNRITGMPVVNDKGKMIGVLSEFDIIQQISAAGGSQSRIFKKPACFSKVVDAVPENTPLDKIIERFINSRFRRLPVTDRHGKLKGIITRRDLMRVFFYRSKLT